MDHRAMKERERMQQEQEKRESEAATKVRSQTDSELALTLLQQSYEILLGCKFLARSAKFVCWKS